MRSTSPAAFPSPRVHLPRTGGQGNFPVYGFQRVYLGVCDGGVR